MQGFPGSSSVERVLTRFSDAVTEEDLSLAWTVANVVPSKALPASHAWPPLGLTSPPKFARVCNLARRDQFQDIVLLDEEFICSALL